MKKQTIKSLLTFLIFNSGILISAKAQIIYHDIIPDVTHTCTGFCTQNYNLDLNNDGITDYIISSNHYFHPPNYCPMCPPTSSSVRILPQGNSVFASTSLNTVKMFSQSDSIGITLLWNGSTSQSLKYFSGTTNGGEWNNAVDKYMGLKLIVGGQNYYGWARLNVTVTLGSATFTIKDYAYNSIPNQPILAGETCFPALLTVTGSSVICPGDLVTINATPGYIYSWSNGDTTSSITVSSLLSTSYSVIVTDTNLQCSTTLTQAITVNVVNTMLTLSGNIILANADTTATYQWINCSTMQIIPGATNSSYLPTSIGSYAVIITKWGCIDTSACVAVIGAGVNELQSQNGISIYPNPVTNSVTIKIPSDKAGEIQIINLFGRVVETHNYASPRDGELQIDVSKFPAGMYVVRWSSGENYQTQKFSVMH